MFCTFVAAGIQASRHAHGNCSAATGRPGGGGPAGGRRRFWGGGYVACMMERVNSMDGISSTPLGLRIDRL